jgi:hypothetical protein
MLRTSLIWLCARRVEGHLRKRSGRLKSPRPLGSMLHGRPANRFRVHAIDRLSTGLHDQVSVLNRDIPDQGLQEGDLGAVVHVYEPDGLEVEFVRALGRTQAVVTLKQDDVRAITDTDLIAVRRLDRLA